MTGRKPAPAKPIYQGPFSSNDVLPQRVAAMRDKILEACESGDIDQLRPAIERNETMPLLGVSGDRPRSFATAIEFLKSRSFDGQGRETLLLLENILSAPCVRETAGVHVSWIWPAWGLVETNLQAEELAEQKARCISFGDFLASKNGAFPALQRVSIGADGTWHLFGPLASG